MTTPRYSNTSIILHWLTVLAIIAAFCVVWALDLFDLEDHSKLIVAIHRSCGLLVILLTVARMFCRATGKAGSPAERESLAHKVAVFLGHLGLYGFMLGVPLIGWAKTSAAGKVVALFGIPMPALLPRNRDLADILGDLHENLAYLFLFLIAAHLLIALWHGLIRRDDVLASMLPATKPSP